MIFDRYTKAIMTVMALALLIIGLNPWINPPEVNADVAGMDYRDLKRDRDFKKAVKSIVENCSVDDGYISC